MNAIGTEPRTDTYQRQVGAYVGSGHDASHLASVFTDERERLATDAAKAKCRRKRKAVSIQDENPN
ncbi:MAG: hypothetical protein ACN6O1_10550 [Comamonas sp.]|uniref:hypothetical protein n=1 Tax=Comamonas sp. TaxID=34028 RepID=UPI003D111F89